jgi:hypothetical protein
MSVPATSAISTDQLSTGGLPKSQPAGPAGSTSNGHAVVDLGIDTSSVLKPAERKANAEHFVKLTDSLKAKQSVKGPFLNAKIQRMIAIALIAVGAALLIIGLAAGSTACALFGALIGVAGGVGYHFTASQGLPRAQKPQKPGKVVIAAETKTSLDAMIKKQSAEFAKGPKPVKVEFTRLRPDEKNRQNIDPRDGFKPGHPNIFKVVTTESSAKEAEKSLKTDNDKSRANTKLVPMGLNKFADVKPAKADVKPAKADANRAKND